jgi:hypothetical protein
MLAWKLFLPISCIGYQHHPSSVKHKVLIHGMVDISDPGKVPWLAVFLHPVFMDFLCMVTELLIF